MSLMDMLLANHTSARDRMAQVMALTAPTASSTGGGSVVSTTGVPSGFTSSGENPWGIDPNGMDLVTARGVTLDADAMASLQAARAAGYNPFPYIGGGYRSVDTQAAMYADRANRSLPIAPPGQSMHNYGLAFDAGNLPADVRSYLLQHGWYWGESFDDPVHYSYGRNG